MINPSIKNFCTVTLFFLLSLNICKCQDKAICKELKSGIFNSYPKNSSDHYLINRSDEFQKEVNTKTGDTVLWKINWISDCTYSLQYISGSEKVTPELSEFYKQHKVVYQIQIATADYYIFKASADKASNTVFQTDTVWMKEKLSIPNNNLFTEIIKLSILKKLHFSDTSTYAVLYVYRSGKTFCMAVDNIIYFDDNIMCVTKNQSAYVFKILKEGIFNIVGKMGGKQSLIKMEVQFGKKYYLKSASKFGHCNLESCCRPELAFINNDKGETEFDEAQ